jgi:hypothetical protein
MINARLHFSRFVAPAPMINHRLHSSRFVVRGRRGANTRLATVGAGLCGSARHFQGWLKATEIGRFADSRLAGSAAHCFGRCFAADRYDFCSATIHRTMHDRRIIGSADECRGLQWRQVTLGPKAHR